MTSGCGHTLPSRRRRVGRQVIWSGSGFVKLMRCRRGELRGPMCCTLLPGSRHPVAVKSGDRLAPSRGQIRLVERGSRASAIATARTEPIGRAGCLGR